MNLMFKEEMVYKMKKAMIKQLKSFNKKPFSFKPKFRI